MSLSDDEIGNTAEFYSTMLNALPEIYWHKRERYAECRTREELDLLLRYGHAIPVRRGLTEAHAGLHFPGWSWNQLIRVLKAAGILVQRGGSPPCVDPGVREFYFDSEEGWLVDWLDEHVTVGLAHPGTTTPAPTGRHRNIYNLATCEMLEEPLEG